MLVHELLALVPPGTEAQVNKAQQKWGVKVKHTIEKGLRLHWEWDDPHGAHKNCRVKIAIPKDGLPYEVARLQVPDDRILAARLSVWRPALMSLQASSSQIGAVLEQNRDLLPTLLPTSGKNQLQIQQNVNIMSHASRVAEDLLRISQPEDFDLTVFLHGDAREDILGVYRYGVGIHDNAENLKTEIELYWGVIGLVAMNLGVDVAGLTIVVLAHELAHAYTHVGHDRSGHRWASQAFHSSERSLKEGLAQYFTWFTVTHLRDEFPEALLAYEALLPKQPSAYRAHVPWLEFDTEVLAAALTGVRRRDIAGVEDFERQYAAMRGQMSGQSA